MIVLEIELNKKGRERYGEYKNSSFYIPLEIYQKLGAPVLVSGCISKKYLKTRKKFHVPDNIRLKIKDFRTLSTQYPHEGNRWVKCQRDFSRTMDNCIAGDCVKLSDLVKNNWRYEGFFY